MSSCDKPKALEETGENTLLFSPVDQLEDSQYRLLVTHKRHLRQLSQQAMQSFVVLLKPQTENLLAEFRHPNETRGIIINYW